MQHARTFAEHKLPAASQGWPLDTPHGFAVLEHEVLAASQGLVEFITSPPEGDDPHIQLFS